LPTSSTPSLHVALPILHLRRLSLAHFPSIATNVSGRSPAIATKGWKGSWRCDRCGYEHRDLQAGTAPRSPQASVPSLLYDVGRGDRKSTRLNSSHQIIS